VYSLALITAPVAQPVSVAEAKKQVELAGGITHHDAHLSRLIRAATQLQTIRTGRQLINATYELSIDRFPRGRGRITLPRWPLQSVTSITYEAGDVTPATLSADAYKVLTRQEPGQVALRVGYGWPLTIAEAEAVTVRFVAGVAATPEALTDADELLKAGILVAVQALWMRDHQQPWEKMLHAAMDIFEGHRSGDDFVEYSHT
jgi:uncharacterized phiE125 gp8 family phage protein